MSSMDLDTFKAKAIAFLDERSQRSEAEDGPFVWGQGSDNVAIVEETDDESEAEMVAKAKEWAAARYDAGFGWINGPVEFGGEGLPNEYALAYRALEAQYEVPDLSIFTINLGMVGPTVAVHARPEVKAEVLPKLYRGDWVSCQLFSEPTAGSDLAAVSAKAVRDGDEWVVTGQKVWTSNAHLADIGEILCRTDFDVPKHAGITGFLVDMKAPGVEVRPLRQMTGGAAFNEVFFDEVRIPDNWRLGEVNEGWGVAMTTLMSERASIGSGMGLGPGPGPFERLTAMVEHFGVGDDPLIRNELANLYMHNRVVAWTTKRNLDRLKAGGFPGPEMSISKLAGTYQLQRVSDFVTRVLGPRLTADTGEWGTFAWRHLVCGMPGARLGGGTDEIIKNILGERVLGLPREPKGQA
ncbi:MAG: acyl-CoA dehydrogenase family protein [Acidimicrobiia bacterium]|nr:acyl-CoA dehydrogenase family protein [Acidimicrobiia bacterium]